MKLCDASDIVGIKDSYILQGNIINYYIGVKKGIPIHDLYFKNNFNINTYESVFELISNENEIYVFYFIEFKCDLSLRYVNLNVFKKHQRLSYVYSMHLIRYCNIVNDVFLNYSLIKTDGDILFLLATDFSKDNIVLFLKDIESFQIQEF